MKISAIVAFYKNLPFLDLVLDGFRRQNYDHKDFEVIIAEDDDAPVTKEYVAKQSRDLPFVLKHVCHEDLGFRKDKILNEAISVSEGEFLVLLDGDCIPHRSLLKEYMRMGCEGTLFFGRRVMMSELLTQKLVASRDRKLLSLYSQVKHGSKRIEDGIYLPFFRKRNKTNGLLGCNWGIMKKHVLEVNGYDEDYVTAGVGEDIDIEWRLKANGIKKQSMRHRAIVYHLHHVAHYSQDAPVSQAMWREKEAAGHIYCLNGYYQHHSI
jgi:cellulose synthase/poly-beta-1,6-N-acetylglucosamine synthase-like glycosyltransferase